MLKNITMIHGTCFAKDNLKNSKLHINPPITNPDKLNYLLQRIFRPEKVSFLK